MHPPHRPLRSSELVTDNTLHVIAVVTNPIRFHSRWILFEEFMRNTEKSHNVNFVVVEGVFKDRSPEIVDENNTNHVRLTIKDELWHKENLINIGVRYLPHNWRYVAWIDADILFSNPDWAQETVHQLQHYAVVQMFEDAVDLGPRNNVVQWHKGFGAQYVKDAPRILNAGDCYNDQTGPFWHPGFAWACTRYFWENTGGLLDFAILGSADHHMAAAIIGEASRTVPKALPAKYHQRVMEWQERALRAGKKNIGFVEGSIQHRWHGPKKKRKYIERWQILISNAYDPDLDIMRDEQGVIVFADANKIRLRDDIRRYFRARSEDSRDED